MIQERPMQQTTAGPGLEQAVVDRPHSGDALSLGIRELRITLIRATNYTDDGYPIKTRVGVIRSNTLTQLGTLTRHITDYPFFSNVPLKVRLVDEAIDRVPVAEIPAKPNPPRE